MFPFPFLSCLHPPRGSPVSSPSAGPRPEPCSPPALLPPGLASGLPHLDLPGPPVWKPVSRAGPAAGLGWAAPGARARRGPTTQLAVVPGPGSRTQMVLFKPSAYFLLQPGILCAPDLAGPLPAPEDSWVRVPNGLPGGWRIHKSSRLGAGGLCWPPGLSPRAFSLCGRCSVSFLCETAVRTTTCRVLVRITKPGWSRGPDTYRGGSAAPTTWAGDFFGSFV